MADRRAQRQGFLISALAHLILLTALVAHPLRDGRATGPIGAFDPPPIAGQRVYLPAPEELRRLLPARPPASRPPAPIARTTPPPSSRTKDRIRVGPPSAERSKGPLVLRRDDDLAAIPRGTLGPPAPATSSAPPASAVRMTEDGGSARTPGLTLPPGLAHLPSGERASSGGEPGRRASIAMSAREYVDRGLGNGALRGLPSGTGKQMGPLFFDPAGADFTEWINHFKNEVYRNWILPQVALLGFRGDVDLAFVVGRDGTLLELTLVRSSGTAALDRAARNALAGSRLLPLPADFGPSEVTMRVRFTYG